jgi:hypothetical protein
MVTIMPSSFNPFCRVVESKEVTSSRIYRRTLWEKIQDTFFVIAGNRGFWGDDVSKNDRGNVIHSGILDYLTFQVTPMINEVTRWSWLNVFKKPAALMLVVPASVLFLASNIIHYALASVLTSIASPIVTIVHIFSQIFGGYTLKKEAEKLNGVAHKKEYDIRNVLGDTLGDFLKGTGHSYSDIIMNISSGDSPKLLVMGNHLHKVGCCDDGSCTQQKGHIQFEVDLKKLMTADDKAAIRALIKLNAGSLRDNLKELSKLGEIEKMVEAATCVVK